MSKKFFILYSHNAIVKGIDKAAVCDLQHGRIFPIPLALCTVIDDFKKMELTDVYKKHTPNNPTVLDKYISFFIDKDLGFYTNDPALFIDMDFSWHCPSSIQNALIEYSFSYNLNSVLEQLDELNCKHVEIRFNEKVCLDTIVKTMTCFENKSFSFVQVLVLFNEEITKEFLENIFKVSKKLTSLIIYGCNNIELTELKLNDRLVVLSEDFRETRFKKSYPHQKLFLNIGFFTEALKHNCYYNRKVSIDKKGNIKNCLRLAEAFGNVNKDKMIDVISREEFQDLWHANVDRIINVKDSIYRYCTFVTNPLIKQSDGLYKIIED